MINTFFSKISNAIESIAPYIISERQKSPLSIQILWFSGILLGTAYGMISISQAFAKEPEEPPIRTIRTITETTVQSAPVISGVKKYDYKEDVKEKWGDQANIMLAVIMAESHGIGDKIGHNCRYGIKIKACLTTEDTKNAVSYDYGLAMISDQHGYSKEYLFDQKNNIEVAYKLYKEQGFDAWFAYRNKKHLKFLQ